MVVLHFLIVQSAGQTRSTRKADDGEDETRHILLTDGLKGLLSQFLHQPDM